MRPAYVERWDDNNVAGTLRTAKYTHDYAGRLNYESYPQRTYGQIGPGTYYAYDALGRQTAIAAKSEVGEADGYAWTRTSYDYGFRTTVSDPRGHVTTYGYQVFDEPEQDAVDNLTAVSLSQGPTARSTVHTYNAGTKRLDSISNGPPGYNVSYQYDSRGNVTKRNAQAFEFDLGNRLRSAPGRATYSYDARYRRVSVVGTDGVNRVQVYSGDGKLLYVAPTGLAATKYIHLGNRVLAEVSGSTIIYDHTDALGSPVAQSNAAGAIITRTRYEPYGYLVAGSPRTIGFTGM